MYLNFLHLVKDKSLIYYHNLKYDWSMLFNHVKVIENPIKCNGKYYEITVSFRGKRLTIRDSLKLINNPLKEFSSLFKIESVKELMPYKIYTYETVNKNILTLEELKNVWTNTPIKYEDFCNHINNFKDKFITKINNIKYFKHMEYMKYYLENDIELLSLGLLRLRRDVYDAFEYKNSTHLYPEYGINKNDLEHIDLINNNRKFYEIKHLDIFNYRSISALSDDYMIKMGCYNDVIETIGSVKNFINKAITGGRTMCGDNKPRINIAKNKEDCMTSFDAHGLYSASMARIEGFPIGKPKQIKTTNYNTIRKYDYYIVKIKILSVGRTSQIPGLKTTIKGRKQWNNNAVGEIMFVDKTTLEDLIKYHKIKFEIMDGLYYNNGFNTKIVAVIKYLFELRKKI